MRYKVSIILPCRNEAAALPACLRQVQSVIQKNNLDAEIIVSDSSTDQSPEIAKSMNTKLVKHDREGYGTAYLEGLKVATGQYIFMSDCDGSYDLKNLPEFIRQLDQGYDLVIGNRFTGQMDYDAMPLLHRYLGNPILSALFRALFNSRVKDVHCGMRAISKSAIEKLNLQTTGMEFASEMIIKSTKNKLRLKQLPIAYHRRQGNSKLKTFRDGWRHLRLMLLYSPTFLFFIPGLILFLTGIGSLLWLYFGQVKIAGIPLDTHPMFLSSLLAISGYQLIFFSAFAKIYAMTNLGEKSQVMEKMFRHITLEKASVIGLTLITIGAAIYLKIFRQWFDSGFGSLSEIRNAIMALTIAILGSQTIFSSFMLSILGIKEK